MQIVKVGNVYLVVKQGAKLTPEQIKSYQSKPEPDLTLAIWSDFPDFNPSLSRELNKLRKQTYIPKQGALQNELSDNCSKVLKDRFLKELTDSSKQEK